MTHSCSKCPQLATGQVRDQYGFRYYCGQHFRAYTFAISKAQDEQEKLQWGSEDWYIEIFGKPKPVQERLL